MICHTFFETQRKKEKKQANYAALSAFAKYDININIKMQCSPTLAHSVRETYSCMLMHGAKACSHKFMFANEI